MERRFLLSANPFTPGDLVVYRVGTGATLAGGATVVSLDEFSTGGTFVQSIPLLSTTTVALTAGGTAPSEGQMTLSPDGSTIALAGYDINGNGATQGSDNGTVALVGASASPTYYVLPGANVVSGNNIRTAVVDGNKLYVSGAAAYVEYANLSSLTAGGTVNAAMTRLNSTVQNVQELQIFNGQLYFSTQKQSKYSISSDSVGSIGTGEPAASGSTVTGIADTSTSSSSFFFEHLGGGAGAPNTLYVADTSVGIEKYSLVGSSWTAEGTVAISGGAVGITGSVDANGYVHVYATNATGVFATTDTSGQSGTFSSGSSPIISAQAGTAIDGIVLTPDDGVGAITGLGGTLHYIQGRPAISLSTAAGFNDASNFDGGKLVVWGAMAGDTLSIASGGSISVSGNVATYAGTQIATFAGGSGVTPMSITFNSVAATPVVAAAVQALIDQIVFSSTTSSVAGTRTLAFQVTENGGATDSAATESVNVSAPAANAPLINALGILNVALNAGAQNVSLTGIQHNGGSGAITITAVSDNPALITSNATITYNSPDSIATLTFTPNASVTGTDHLIVTVADSAGTSLAVLTINVIGAPLNIAPSALAVVAGKLLTFASASGDPISVADAAVGSGTAEVSLSVSHGTLTTGSTSGITITGGSNGSGAFTLTGSLTDLNAALVGLTYTPASGYIGSDSVEINSSDLGHTALGYTQTATSTVSLSVAAAPAVLLNEIESNEPGTDDNRYQYVELIGMPGALLNNVYFVAFGGEHGNVGVAQVAVNLSGYSIGSDGLLVIQSGSGAGQTVFGATTLVPDTTYFTITGGFPNGSLSFYLFDSPNVGVVAGNNYDTNTDGTLVHLPAGAASLDDIAILNTNNPGDITYGGVQITEIASLNKGTVDAVTRFPNANGTASSAWFGGELNDVNNKDSQLLYDPARESASEPANASLSPGQPNYPQTPLFNSASYLFSIPKTSVAGGQVGAVLATPGDNDTLTYSLTGNGSSNFTISSTGGTIIVASGASLSGTTYNLSVTATDNQDNLTATVPVAIHVTLISTSVAIASSGSAQYGQFVTFTATVTPVSGGGETGSVQFVANGQPLDNPGALINGVATLQTASLDAGIYSITAIYSGDSNFAGNTSSVLNQTISAAPLILSGPAFYLRLDQDGTDLDVWDKTTSTGVYDEQILLSDVQSVSVQGTTGSDFLTVDLSAGNPLPPAGLSDAGGGNGSTSTLQVIGSGGSDSLALTPGHFSINNELITFSNIGQTTFIPGNGIDSLAITSASLILSSPADADAITAMTFSSISLMSNAGLTVQQPATPAVRSVIVTSNLSMPPGSKFDLTANDLIVHGGNVASISSQVKSSDASSLTTLGVIQNSLDGTPGGAALYATNSSLGGFDGVDTVSADVLVKYTEFGDTNLDGSVDGTDYGRLDNGFLNRLTNWANGDLNYDGIVDGSDYTLMDNSFNSKITPAAIVNAKAARLTAVFPFKFSTTIDQPATLPSVEQRLTAGDVLDHLTEASRA